MFKNLKWTVIIVSFLLLISIFYGFQFYQQKQTVEEPLFKLFYEVKEVKDAEIRHGPEYMTLILDMEYVNNLYFEEKLIRKEVEEIIGKREYKLEFKDNRNRELEQIYHKVHYSLFEAAAKGNFVQMSGEVEDIMNNYKVDDYCLVVGEENLYFQLQKGDYYMYEIVPRFPSSNEIVKGESDSL